MTEAELLTALPDMVFRAVLMLARIGAVVMLLPGLGEQEIPANIRLGLGLALVMVLYPLLADSFPSAPDGVGELLRLIGTELVIGIWYGALARLVSLAMTMAGQLFALLLGLSQMLVPDPAMGGQNAVTGRFFTLMAVVLLLGSGLYAVPLRALLEGYAVLPVGGGFLAGPGAEAMAAAVGQSFLLALQLMAPFLLLSVVLNVAFGEETIAVDTHIFRVSNRTGLAPGKDVLEVEKKLLKRVPAAVRQGAHHWLILHGRYVCQARTPQCSACSVSAWCDMGRSQTKTAAPTST